MEDIPICECATFWEAHHDECPVRREVESLRATIKQRCIDSSVEAQRAFLAEIDALRAELAEARKPTCNACANFHSCWSRSWNNPSWARVFCPDGERFERVDPVRLYEIDAAMAGGAK